MSCSWVKPIAPWHWWAERADALVGVGCPRLRHCHVLGHVLIGGLALGELPSGFCRSCAGQPSTSGGHVRDMVLDRLERAYGASELYPLLSVSDGHV